MSEPFLGEIKMVGFNFNPRGWAFCNGQILSINSNQALYALLGTTYGGDGRIDFALPDLRGRVPIQHGSGPGLSSYALGQRGGSATNTLTTAQLPGHSHSIPATDENANSRSPIGNALAETRDLNYSTGDASGTLKTGTGNSGGGQAVNNMQPFLTINFVIAIFGLFPSRN